jgi:diacylglycerol O-acyltransferase / wax synthase
VAIERLTAEDDLMLRMDEVWPQDVGALTIFEGGELFDPVEGVRLDEVHRRLAGRLHLVPRFRQRIRTPRRGLGGRLWEDDPSFRLEDHVHLRPLPPGSGEAGLLAAMEEIRSRRLDASRPLWEMWLLPGALEGRIGLFVRMHHAIGDGRAAMTILGALLDPVADTPIPLELPWDPAPGPSWPALLADSLRRRAGRVARAIWLLLRPWVVVRAALGAWPALRELVADEPAPATSLDRLVGPGRRIAVVRARTDDVRHVARAHGATSNDLLLALVTGGLRALLSSRGEAVDDLEVRAYVPVSLRGRMRGTTEGNLITQMVVPLPVGEADPARRLRTIAAVTSARKPMRRASLGSLFRIGWVSRLLLEGIKRQRVNVTCASVPGPRRPLYIGSARLVDIFPLENLIGKVSLGVAAISYAGAHDICITADRDAYPDLERFSDGMCRELEALRSAVRT